MFSRQPNATHVMPHLYWWVKRNKKKRIIGRENNFESKKTTSTKNRCMHGKKLFTFIEKKRRNFTTTSLYLYLLFTFEKKKTIEFPSYSRAIPHRPSDYQLRLISPTRKTFSILSFNYPWGDFSWRVALGMEKKREEVHKGLKNKKRTREESGERRILGFY